jgi:hypothetical protein
MNVYLVLIVGGICKGIPSRLGGGTYGKEKSGTIRLRSMSSRPWLFHDADAPGRCTCSCVVQAPCPQPISNSEDMLYVGSSCR